MHLHFLRSAATVLLAAVCFEFQAMAQIAGGAGPSVMSRGGNVAGRRGEGAIDFVFYGGVMGTYETGILFPTLDAEGQPQSADVYGASVNVGAYGSHDWGRSSLGLDYRGGYRHYPRRQAYNGSDHAISLDYRRILSRRWEMVVRETAGTTSQAFGGFVTPAYVTPDYISIPTTEIYNSRVYYTQTMAHAAYQPGARTMFTMGAGVYKTYRQARALANSNGYLATGSGQYRLNRTTAVGFQYSYMRFSFPRVFGSSDSNGAALTFERILGRYSRFTVHAGAYRVETLGSESYVLPPEIAEILGRTSGVRAFYRVNYVPQASATLAYRRRQTSYNVGYSYGTTPGNGVYPTSKTQIASGGISYSGIERASIGFNASYTRMGDLTNRTSDPFDYYQAGIGWSYNLGRGLNMIGQADWRQINTGPTLRARNGYVFGVGLSFASASIPLSIW